MSSANKFTSVFGRFCKGTANHIITTSISHPRSSSDSVFSVTRCLIDTTSTDSIIQNDILNDIFLIYSTAAFSLVATTSDDCHHSLTVVYMIQTQIQIMLVLHQNYSGIIFQYVCKRNVVNFP